MAFWLVPGQKYPQGCGGQHQFVSAQNRGVRAGYRIHKRVTVGAAGIPNAIEYAAEFTIPNPRTSATFELATAYMPPEFTAFFTWDPAPGRVAPGVWRNRCFAVVGTVDEVAAALAQLRARIM